MQFFSHVKKETLLFFVKTEVPILLKHYNLLPLKKQPKKISLRAFGLLLALAIIGLFVQNNLSGEAVKSSPVSKKQSVYFGNNYEGKQLSKEALLWLSVLKSYKEKSLSHEELMQKFKNMSTAYTILSSTSGGDMSRRYWSAEAIKYGRLSAGVMEGMMARKDAVVQSEINTRLLIAMGLNHYVGGRTDIKELVAQFEKIPSSFLIRSGFCNNRILLALHNDQIIQLPFLEI